MAELNDKLISYGNLSTFYDKLQEQGLSGNAIEDASVLPDASANKNKFVRLASDKKVYVSECTSEGNPGLGFAAIQVIISEEYNVKIVYKRYTEGDNSNQDEGYENYQICWVCVQQSYEEAGSDMYDTIDKITDWQTMESESRFYYTISENPSIGDEGYEYNEGAMHTVGEYEPNVGYVPATWAWKQLDDSIVNVQTLPDAEANKDKIVRLQSNEKVYTSVILPSTSANRLPDEQQINKAYIYDSYNNTYSYYKGAWKLSYDGGVLDVFYWKGDDINFYTYDNAVNISNTTRIINENWLADVDDIDYENRTTYTYDTISSINDATRDNLATENWFAISITYNAPEEWCIGNAVFYGDDVKMVYTGEVDTLTVDGSEITVYKWEDRKYGSSSYYQYSTKPASEISFINYEKTQYQHYIYSDTKFYYIRDGITYIEDEMWDMYIPQITYEWKGVVTEPELNIINESLVTGATLTVDGSQPSIVASGSTTILWDDLVSSIPSGKSVEVSVVLINTGNSALTPTIQGNYQMMGDGNLTIQAGELGLYRGRYISALNKWLIEAIYQEVSGIME